VPFSSTLLQTDGTRPTATKRRKDTMPLSERYSTSC
jgi:hypothetical protein